VRASANYADAGTTFGRGARRLEPAKPGMSSQVSCGETGFAGEVVDGLLVVVADGAQRPVGGVGQLGQPAGASSPAPGR
jgi:hypothetical protein